VVATAATAGEGGCAVPEAAVAKLEGNTPVVIVLLALASADADIDVTLIVPDALEAVDFWWLLELVELDAIIEEVVVGEAWATGTITM